MKFFKITFWIIFLIVLIFLIFSFFQYNSEKHKITFLDVGQGNGVLIQDGERNILIDTGNEFVATKSLTKALGFFDRKIDIIFASHYDLDHIGLLPYYLRNYKVGMFVDSGVIISQKDSQWPLYQEIKDLIKKKKVIKKTGRSGDEFIFNDDFKIKVLFPGRFLDVNKLKSNSGSLVLKIFFYGKKILLTGDLPQKFEKVLIQRYGDELKSDILLAGHHGSKTSSSEEFLKVVNPEHFVISVGEDNSYGHPNKEVLDRAERLGFKILRTDLLGSISF